MNNCAWAAIGACSGEACESSGECKRFIAGDSENGTEIIDDFRVMLNNALPSIRQKVIEKHLRKKIAERVRR